MNAKDAGTDAELVQRAAGGEQRAFTLLMRRHKDTLYRSIRRYVGDADEAYDLLQETFVSAWSALDRFDRARPFEIWLRRIGLNKCRDWSRRRAVRRILGFGGADMRIVNQIEEPAPDSETVAADREQLLRIDQAIRALPASLKEPLLLTAIDGLSHQQAGQVLGVSAKAVETRVYRARRKLMDITGLN